jgi:hypothetical protein
MNSGWVRLPLRQIWGEAALGHIKEVKYMGKKREIEAKKIMEVMARLNEIPAPVLSARQFIAQNFDTLHRSGKTLKALYQFLSSNGIDVGSYSYFKETYNRLKCMRENSSPETAPKERIVESQKMTPVSPAKGSPAPRSTPLSKVTDHTKSEDTGKNSNDLAVEATVKPELYGNQPIKGADGVNYYIDPATGGRKFKV